MLLSAGELGGGLGGKGQLKEPGRQQQEEQHQLRWQTQQQLGQKQQQAEQQLQGQQQQGQQDGPLQSEQHLLEQQHHARKVEGSPEQGWLEKQQGQEELADGEWRQPEQHAQQQEKEGGKLQLVVPWQQVIHQQQQQQEYGTHKQDEAAAAAGTKTRGEARAGELAATATGRAAAATAAVGGVDGSLEVGGASYLPWCCVLYTSGSTGVPMGVCGTEQGIINRCSWQQQKQHQQQQPALQGQEHEQQQQEQQEQQQYDDQQQPLFWFQQQRQAEQYERLLKDQLMLSESLPLRAGSVVAFSSSPVFVDHMWQLFAPLLCGVPMEVVLMPEELVTHPGHFVEALRSHRVTQLVRWGRGGSREAGEEGAKAGGN